MNRRQRWWWYNGEAVKQYSAAIACLVVVLMLGFGLARVASGAGTEPAGLDEALRDQIRAPSSYINVRVLAANTAETVTAPTFAGYPSAKVVGVFSPSCSNWYYNTTATAAVPAADVTDGGGAARAPTALKMAQGATLSVVADATCILTTEWYLHREP